MIDSFSELYTNRFHPNQRANKGRASRYLGSELDRSQVAPFWKCPQVKDFYLDTVRPAAGVPVTSVDEVEGRLRHFA